MATVLVPTQSLWQPQIPTPPPAPIRSDRLWRSTSYIPQATSQTQLWRKPRPTAPPKPETLRAPGLWRSTSYSPERPAKITHNKRLSRSLSSRSASPSPSDRNRSWVDSVLPSYVGRSHHYTNSHSVWAEQMFQQRRQSTTSWIDSILPSYVGSGDYQTSYAIWAEQNAKQGNELEFEASWVDSILPAYVSSGPYQTSHQIWSQAMSQSVDNLVATWVDSVLPPYVKSGVYRTSHSMWSEDAPRNGANVSWIDDILPLYVNRSTEYRTSYDLAETSTHERRLALKTIGRSISSPSLVSSPLPSGVNTPTSASSSQFRIHQPTSFLHHRNTSQSEQEQKVLPRTVAFHPPNSLFRSASSMSANEEPARMASLLSPPDHQAALGSLRTPASARFAQLQSPCLFHKRFDDAVNLDRVLEEIEEEEGLTSGRLMQTATSVREISKQLQRKPIKRAVRSIMIVTKARDNSLVYLTRELALWLLSTPRYGKQIGVNVYVDAKLKNSKRFNAEGIVAQNPAFATMLRYWDPDLCYSSPEKFDLVLTLGGDGTVLFSSFSLFQRVVPPVLAFGLGSLGFLTPFNFNNYRNSLNKVMGDEGMRVNLRMRFTCTVFRAPTHDAPRSAKARKALPSPVDTAAMVEGEQFEVLNELVIDRGPSPYVSNLELYADDSLLTVVQADGCIFSTPTGSTAYSLSAGGPLTDPSIPGLVLTPICPHTLSFRPMVLSDQLCLKVCIPRDSRSTAYASFDGKHRIELRRGDCVRIEAGRYPFPTVVDKEGAGAEWFSSVRRALRWNTRGAMQKAFSSGSGKPPVTNGRFEEDADEMANKQISSLPEEDENEDDDDDDEEQEEPQEEEWDIDFAPMESESRESAGVSVVDSGIGLSESGCSSPVKRMAKETAAFSA